MRSADFARGRQAARAGMCGWLLVALWPMGAFFSAGPDPLRAGWALVWFALFAWCWVAIVWRLLSDRSGVPRRWALAGLVAAALALAPVLGAPWAFVAFLYVVSGLAATLGGAGFAAGVALTAAVTMAVLLDHGQPAWWLLLVILAEAGAVHGLKHMGRLIARLDAAQAQVARLAVDNERLRFARDLHDTLGHTLTSITIRSQLAARLARTDPGRAAREMGDVEAAARQALDEVRHAVAGYRAPALSEELEKAARGLELAGVEVEVRPAGGPIPGPVETLLAWAVREGATNVLRHSGARRCWITLSVDPAWAGLEVRDDGPAPDHEDKPRGGLDGGPRDGLDGGLDGRSPSRLGGSPGGIGGSCGGGSGRGNGLTGLAERVAGVGGSLDAGALPGGGYRLVARVPLEVP
ncbi:sensor histidine kinase [Nonomuraea sp. NPDC050790]|uniref:sensor histidine kinase n=1 Tax=Nonomuraea sp. NPDC050790 TaxID=3364371 RepID=UPI0037B28E74